MKISKNSWHYRLNSSSNEHFAYWFDRGRYTTCSYVRRTLMSLAVTFFKGAVILAGALTLLGVLYSMIAYPISHYLGYATNQIVEAMALVGWIFTIIGVLFGIIYTIHSWAEKRARKSKPFERRKKEHGVFVQAIIDKHNKFCTLVTAE